ncbi:MAG: hypothetical protein RI907_3302 [Pseudomonadota bacterium]|jgi:hypothetical protein
MKHLQNNHRWWAAALLSAAASSVSAQSLPSTFQATTLTMPSGLNATPLAINSQGQVGGFGLKSAGSVLKVGTRPTFPYGSTTYLYWDPQSYIYPVVWTNGTPSQLTRYKSTYNTSIYAEAAAGAWLTMTTNSAAKVSTAGVGTSGLVKAQELGLTLTNGVYAPLQPDSSTFGLPPLVNRKGTLVGISQNPSSRQWDVLVSVHGQQTRVPMPSGTDDWRVVGISDDDQVLIEVDLQDQFTRVGDTITYTQYRWQKRCYVWKAGNLTEVLAPTPYPVVSVNCGGIGPDGLVAAYVSHAAGGELSPFGLTKALFTWRNGQVQRFQTDFKVFSSDALPGVSLTQAGWGVYSKPLDGNSSATVDPQVFLNGQHVRLAPLIRPAIGATDLVFIKSVNASGQILAQVVPAAASAAPRFVVLTPR